MPISAAGSKRCSPANAGAQGDENRRSWFWNPAFAGAPSRAGNARDGGFTLVELMVVITIIGLASAVALWAMPDPRGRVMDEAARFAVRVRAAHDTAIVEARPVSVWMTPGGYGFDRRIAGSWSPLADKPLRVERWNDGTRAQLDDTTGRTRVTFDETGLADRGAQVTLSRGGNRAVVVLDADGTVRVAG